MLAVVLAASPFIFLLVLAFGVTWDPWRSRFFLFPVALAAAAWGPAVRFRWLAWGATGLTVITVVLVLANIHTKPLGVRLLASHATESVFGAPRYGVQSWIRVDGTKAVLAYVEQKVPADARIGLALRFDDFIYPYFGPRLGRTVRMITDNGAAAADAWIIEAPGHDVRRCAESWETALETPRGFRVLRRTAADTCAVPTGF